MFEYFVYFKVKVILFLKGIGLVFFIFVGSLIYEINVFEFLWWLYFRGEKIEKFCGVMGVEWFYDLDDLYEFIIDNLKKILVIYMCFR